MTEYKKNAIKYIGHFGFIAILIYEAYIALDGKQDILDLRQKMVFSLPYFLLCCIIFSAVIFSNKGSEKEVIEKTPPVTEAPAASKRKQLFSFWSHLPWYINGGILLMSLVMAFLCFYDINYFDILPDESLHINAAKGYNETGSFKSWDFLRNTTNGAYYRAWSYTYLVAISFKLLGVSVAHARFVSALFGVLFVPIIFRISMYFTKSYTSSLLTTLSCMFCPFFLVYFRRIRMYSMLLPVFAMLYYFTVRVLNESSERKKIFNSEWLGKILDFKMPLLAISLLLLFLSYNIHQLSLLSLVALFLYFLYLAFTNWQPKLLAIFTLGILCFLYFILKPEVFSDLDKIFSFFKRDNQIYSVFLLQSLFSLNFSIAILATGTLLFLTNKNKKMLVAMYAMIASTICLFVYCIDYDIHFRYISYTIPFFFMLMFYNLDQINRKIKPRYLSVVFPVVSIIVVLMQFSNSKESIYYQNPEAQFNSKAYKTMKRQFDPQTQQILALFPAEFYLDEMDPNTPLTEIPKNQQMSLGQLNYILSKKPGTWVTWPTHKSRHLKTDIIEKINNTCKKYHGYGLDNTFVEMYFCTQ